MSIENERRIKISPSLICTDLCNLEAAVKELEALGVDYLHIDIIDGYFSPCMPIGLDTIRQLRKRTSLPFDVHIMVRDNSFFINQMIEMEVHQMCFHCESELHIDRILNLIRKNNIKAGIALTPSTPISILEYIYEYCDFVLLMLINPGFAENAGEHQVPYANKKISDCYKFLKSKEKQIPIEVDGRVSFDSISGIVSAGADVLVTGSKSLFAKSRSIIDNYKKIETLAKIGLKSRE